MNASMPRAAKSTFGKANGYFVRRPVWFGLQRCVYCRHGSARAPPMIGPTTHPICQDILFKEKPLAVQGVSSGQSEDLVS